MLTKTHYRRVHQQVLVALAWLLLSGCIARSNCAQLPAPQFGGEGALTPSEVIVFHGCHDGDTCTFTLPTVPPPFGNEIPVRIAGIDTPEIRGRCIREIQLAQQAKGLANDLLRQAHTIELKDMRRDKYFRVLATVLADGKDVSRALIEARLAVPYHGGTKTAKWC